MLRRTNYRLPSHIKDLLMTSGYPVISSNKIDAVKLQLLSLLKFEEVNSVAAPTKYGGVTILDLDESTVSTLNSIGNIEALILDEAAAAELVKPSAASNVLSFKSLDSVDKSEQYEFLSRLLHIQKATRDKR